jgi:hypothetical protein
VLLSLFRQIDLRVGRLLLIRSSFEKRERTLTLSAMCKENGPDEMATPEPKVEGDDDLHERAMKWPEDPVDSVSWLYRVYGQWTYSYMNLVLEKGKNQTKNQTLDGTQLTQDDLYRVPDAMRSNLLSEKFR